MQHYHIEVVDSSYPPSILYLFISHHAPYLIIANSKEPNIWLYWRWGLLVGVVSARGSFIIESPEINWSVLRFGVYGTATSMAYILRAGNSILG
jgi:hypothetical protein